MQPGAVARRLIVNADDFGLTSGVNRGIIEACERGILTSASLMVRESAAAEAADYARQHPAFSVGLHFDAAEWRFERDAWVQNYVIVDSSDENAVRLELQRQLNAFTELVHRTPTHLDSHQHMHLREPARSVLLAAANELGIPLRGCTPVITYSGAFYGQTIEGERYEGGVSPAKLIRMIEKLPTGWTELGTHPGYGAGLASIYAAEREEELRTLCDPDVRVSLTTNHVQLCSFHDARL